MHPLVKSSSFPFVGELFYVSKLETGFIAKEIWGDRLYDGDAPLELPPDAVVVDAGANVGVYSLYVHGLRADRKPTIYAFEPIPALFSALEANVRTRGAAANVRLFNLGLSDRACTATFQFYRNMAACSSIEDRDAELRAIAEGQDVDQLLRTFYPSVYVFYRLVPPLRPLLRRAIMRSALAKEAVQARLVTLSQVIAEEKIERIDLLKIDAERSELPILRGIAERDWPKIRRLVVEANGDAARDDIVDLLRARGFRVRQRRDIANCTIVYAARPE